MVRLMRVFAVNINAKGILIPLNQKRKNGQTNAWPTLMSHRSSIMWLAEMGIIGPFFMACPE